MRKLYLVMMLIFALAPESSYAQMRLGDNTAVVFATLDEAKEILSSRDDFVRRMSPFDRAARMKTDRDVSEEEYLRFVSNNILAWNDAEKQRITSAYLGIQKKLEELSMPFPTKIFIVKTTGKEEGGAAYTRANAIVVPKTRLFTSTEKIQKMITHELFHIMSRSNPDLREKLYAAIGFIKCNEIEFPLELKSRKITNPDAPRNDHCIRIQVDGNGSWAIPILFSSTERYDTTRGGEFFKYLQFRFLIVERLGNSRAVKPVIEGGKPRLVRMQKVSGFIEQVGRNTDYIIHPEEILADNFVLFVLGEHDVPSPEIVKKLEGILMGG